MLTSDQKILHSLGLPLGPADALLVVKLAKDEGYEHVLDMLQAAVADSVVPCICTECTGATSGEPDARENWCERCGTNTVRSCLDIVGII